MSPQVLEHLEELSEEERVLLQEVLKALRDLRYGSVVLTVHDGRLVEVQKTQRIRLPAPGK